MRQAYAIDVRAVQSKADLRTFVRLPRRLYRDDPNWVPPIEVERRHHFSTANPYFQHASAQFFVAWRAGRPVGRISAQINHLAQSHDGPRVGHFGLLEACDQDVLSALLATAEAWLGDRGAAVAEGPHSLSVNDETGLLVNGFDRPPRLLMNYAPPWYAPTLEAAGYGKAKDLLAYRAEVAPDFPARAAAIARAAEADPAVGERRIDLRDLKREMQLIVDIFNDGWAGNWGFVPMTEPEVRYMTGNLKPVLRPDLVRIAEYRGEPVAMMVAVPDLHTVLRDIRGQLLPVGWARLLWGTKLRPPAEGRVMLMGVRRSHQSGHLAAGLVALMMQRLHAAAQQLGMTEFELSWILEDNTPVLRLIEMIGAHPDKRYRIYRREIE